MAYLGVPYLLAYVAKNFRTGLTDVFAMVRKPDGTVVGPFAMPESTGIGFAGMYMHDFVSDTQLDREGEYLAQMVSPTENLRGPLRFTLERRPFVPFGSRIVLVKPDFNPSFGCAGDDPFITMSQTDAELQANAYGVDLKPTSTGGIELNPGQNQLEIQIDQPED